ncbi:MAG TPA: histidine kinase [Rhodothermales bacterium]|nr:histidine kinase [Rhodothermales bacterium]
MLIAGVYTFVICGANMAAGFAARRLLPVRRVAHVSVHAGAMALATALGFLFATELVVLLFAVRFSGGALATVAAIAFAASLVGTGLVQGLMFYGRMQEAERAALDAELRALRAQINPHFLFNALNTIATLIPVRPADAEKATEDLADLFRYSLRASKHPTVTLADELGSVMVYLSLERARFGDRLQVEVRVPEALRSARVPSLILQPIVENAVKHGVGQTKDPCTVMLEARREGRMLELLVRDTGPGFASIDPDMVMRRGDGLSNVARRLELAGGDQAGLEIRRDGVRLWLPLEPGGPPTVPTPDTAEEQG